MKTITSLFFKNINKTCDSVLLCDFIECTTHKKFNRIKRLKWIPIPKFILAQAWSILFEEYCTLSRNSGYESFYEGMQKVYRLDAKLLAITCAVKALSQQYDKKCVDILNSFGYTYKFDWNNKKEYFQNLNKVIGKCKVIAVERDREKARFEALTKDSKKQDPGVDYFNTSLITLSKYMGYHLNPKEITVAEFCGMTAGYEKEIEHLTKQKS